MNTAKSKAQKPEIHGRYLEITEDQYSNSPNSVLSKEFNQNETAENPSIIKHNANRSKSDINESFKQAMEQFVTFKANFEEERNPKQVINLEPMDKNSDELNTTSKYREELNNRLNTLLMGDKSGNNYNNEEILEENRMLKQQLEDAKMEIKLYKMVILKIIYSDTIKK